MWRSNSDGTRAPFERRLCRRNRGGEVRKGGVAPPPRMMARKEALIGRKVGMTQVFGDDGNHVPVTVVQAGPCTVVGVRTRESHGYDALQLGFETKKKMSKPAAGVFKKANLAPMRVVREIRLEKSEQVAR